MRWLSLPVPLGQETLHWIPSSALLPTAPRPGDTPAGTGGGQACPAGGPARQGHRGSWRGLGGCPALSLPGTAQVSLWATSPWPYVPPAACQPQPLLLCLGGGGKEADGGSTGNGEDGAEAAGCCARTRGPVRTPPPSQPTVRGVGPTLPPGPSHAAGHSERGDGSGSATGWGEPLQAVLGRKRPLLQEDAPPPPQELH